MEIAITKKFFGVWGLSRRKLLRRSRELHRQEAPNSVADRKSMYYTSNSSYGTVNRWGCRRDCNWSSRTSYIDLYRAHIFIQELPVSIPEEHSRSWCKDLARKISAGSSHKELKKTLSKILMLGQHPQQNLTRLSKGPAAAGADPSRSWYKNLPRTSQKSFHASTSKTWRLHAPHARTS